MGRKVIGKLFGISVILGLSVLLLSTGCSKGGSSTGIARISVSDSVNPQNDSLVSFGTIAAGYSSMEAVVVTNNGNGPLLIGQVAANYVLAAPFSISLDTCSGATLLPGSKCDLMIRFAPLSSGTFTGAFDIPSNDPDHPEAGVAVIGAGTYAVPVPHIVVTDSVAPADDLILAFGTLNLSTSATRTVTIGNDGTVNLVIGQIGQAYRLIGPFSLTESCSGKSIAPSQTCVFTVEYHPDIAGDFSGGFDIPSNDPRGSVGFGVVGSAVDLISPTRLDFGNVAVNQTSDLVVTATNTVSSNIVVGQIASLDPLAAPFSIIADGCTGTTLVPAASCQVTVRYAPTAQGSFADSFDIPVSGGMTGDIPISVKGASGTGTVSGTITMPAPATGTCYAVVLSTSIQLTDLFANAVATTTGQTNGTSTISYSITDIPPGQYYLFAGVDNDASSASAPACSFGNGTPTTGDYVGFYGGGFPSSPNAIVSIGTNTLDFSLTTY